RCPRCGAVLFDDMEVCYACLYDFSKDRAAQRRAQMPPMPGDPELSTADVVGLVDGWAGSEPEVRDAPMDDGYLWGELFSQEDEDDPWADMPDVAESPLAQRPQEAWDQDEALPAAAASLRPAHASHDWAPTPTDSTAPLPRIGVVTDRLGVRVETDDMDVTCRIPADGLAVGRGDDNDVILRARSVSRHHVRLFPSAAGVVAEDQGATNPALVLGSPLTGSRTLKLGDVLDIGGTRLTLVPVNG
ncbi:MAG: FHA domain-containing protein, partial [Atopobiaceae bacterium]|nr:FHA domain-containing protein [Atopobiaceae bacterium]